jgi:uncharacterized membrane protein (UPF0127 family)
MKKNSFSKILLIFFSIMIGVSLAYFIFTTHHFDSNNEITHQTPQPQKNLQRGTVEIIRNTEPTSSLIINVDFADSFEERRVGLMHLKSLPQNEGMLFTYRHSKIHHFTMKNTLIPLDMIFISSEEKIVDILKERQPETLGPHTPSQESLYVLEVNGGLSENENIQIGDKVIISR